MPRIDLRKLPKLEIRCQLKIEIRVVNMNDHDQADTLISRSARTDTPDTPLVASNARTRFWIPGESLRSPMTCVTRARVTPSRRAMSARFRAFPESSRDFHSLALCSARTAAGTVGPLSGFGRALRAGRALTTRSAGTWRVRTPILPFSKVTGPADTAGSWPNAGGQYRHPRVRAGR